MECNKCKKKKRKNKDTYFEPKDFTSSEKQAF